MSANKPSILVVGSINMDLVLETPRIPEGGESLIGSNYQYIPGGKGDNQAVAASRLGADVTFVGKVGEDAQGQKLIEKLTEADIATDYLKVDEDSQTGLAVIMLEENAQNRIIVYPGANMEIEKSELAKAFNRDYDALLLQLEIDDEIVVKACNLAEERDIPVVLDAGPARSFPLEKIQGLEILSPNETEARALTGIKVETRTDALYAAQKLTEKSRARYIVIKMGAKGAFLYDQQSVEKLLHFPGYEVEAVDTTAGGDAFTAAMTLEYLRNGGDIKQAIKFANAAGALTVTKLGAQPSLPSAAEIEKFLGTDAE